jgi:hypothetical protein
MRRQGHEYGILGDQETGIKPFELSVRKNDPITAQVNVSLLRVSKNGEHVDMPLTKFVNPIRDARKRLGIHDDVVEPFLEI